EEDGGDPAVAGDLLYLGDPGRGRLHLGFEAADADLLEVVPVGQVAEGGVRGDEGPSPAGRQPGCVVGVQGGELGDQGVGVGGERRGLPGTCLGQRVADLLHDGDKVGRVEPGVRV